MRSFAVVFAVSLVAALIYTPIVRRAAIRLGAVDIPDDRKVHAEPTPLLGGVAIYLAVLTGLIAAWLLPGFRDLFGESTEPIGVVLAGLALLALGVVDDVRGLPVSTRIAGQALAAGILVLAGVQLVYFWVPGVGILSLSPDLSALLTVVWTIAVINAVNLIDGLDGLAVGVTVLAAAAFFVYASETSEGASTTAELLTVIVVGAGLGFLRYNFHPARIFMGDAGAYLLGMVLASATVSAIGRTTEPQFIDVAGFVVPALLPLIVVAIPLADAGLAILRRVRGGRPVFHADKRHIHHWLMDMADSHRRAVLVMYFWTAMLAGAALVLAIGPGLVWRLVSAGMAVLTLVSVAVLPRLLRRRVAAARAVQGGGS